MSRTTDLPQLTKCPHCAYGAECATGVRTDATPKPGSINLCFGCGELSLFDDELKLRMPTVTELLEMQRDKEGWAELMHLQTVVKRDARNRRIQTPGGA